MQDNWMLLPKNFNRLVRAACVDEHLCRNNTSCNHFEFRPKSFSRAGLLHFDGAIHEFGMKCIAMAVRDSVFRSSFAIHKLFDVDKGAPLSYSPRSFQVH